MVKDETMETEAVFKDNKKPNQSKTKIPQKRKKTLKQKKGKGKEYFVLK